MSHIPAIVDYLKELNILSVIVRILLAIICGGVIGIERRRAHQPAGMRTYMLVCMGAAIVMATDSICTTLSKPEILPGLEPR